jgi:spermidine dehydrogenase
MNKIDKKLGMEAQISRRDILHGLGAVSVAASGIAMSPSTWSIGNQLIGQHAHSPPWADRRYPPARTGMRGNHDGAFEVAHKLARSGRTNWGIVKESDPIIYDLVVVGGGISGLSAAYFYRIKYPKANILILDNHDDFGGHAKRNEFRVGNKKLISYGGSSYLVNPSEYSDVVKDLMGDLGVDFNRFEETFDLDFYEKHKLAGGLYFTKNIWGVNRTVPFPKGYFGHPLTTAGPLSLEEAIQNLPISKSAKEELLYLLSIEVDQIPHVRAKDKYTYLSSISYREFLEKDLKISEPQIFAMLQDLTVDNGLGIEAVDAFSALSYSRLPGWYAAGLPPKTGSEYKPPVHRFPDGNASIARLLVRKMIANVADGSTMDDIVTASFDYSKLDLPESPTRLRLNSTVIDVEHNVNKAGGNVAVRYIKDEQQYQIFAKHCVLACNNSMIPYLCPSLPKSQKEALADQVKQPIMFTRVALKNWKALKKLGMGSIMCPGSYYINVQISYPLNFHGYTFNDGPDSPIVVNLDRYPHINNQGLTAKQQYRQARYELLTTSFEEIERHTRAQLSGLLEGTGFNPATDIEAITVNRWAHGYAYDISSHILFDKLYDDYDDPRYPHVKARKRFGQIAIANADAGASAMIESAVEQAHRAVNELV